MPLIKSKSKVAFENNMKAEMQAGKPKDQSLAIAYDVKRRSKKKKMAEGGMINESARSERRPMPEERDKDSAMVSRNSGDKPAHNDDWADRSTVAQAQRPSITKLSRPKMANGIFKVRDRDDVDAEERMMSSMPPASDKQQPAKELDEEGADRQGPSSKDLKLKMMAEGGMINDEVSMKRAEDDEVEHPAGLESDDDQRGPAEDEYMAPHFAEGGMAHEMDDQPTEEEEMEHHDSIAAAIMSKRDREKAMMSDSDIDEMERLYNGGQVEGSDESQADIMENGEEHPNAYYGHNEEILKENYMEDMRHADQPMDSNEMGDSREDESENKHDMISQIRSKMNRQRQFKVR